MRKIMKKNSYTWINRYMGAEGRAAIALEKWF